MSKHILILSTSLRKGSNSDALAQAFAKGAQKMLHADVLVFAGGVTNVGDAQSHPALEEAYCMGANA